MAKTKLLADIGTQSGVVGGLVIKLATQLESAAALTDAHWTLLSDIKTEMDKLDQTVGKMEARIKSWDGSTKLRDAFKNKAQLAAKREDAKKKFEALKKDVHGFHDSYNETIKMMQAVSKK